MIPGSEALRSARVGELLPALRTALEPRRLRATAFILPGPEPLTEYVESLGAAGDDFAAWDGRVVDMGRDGEPQHRVVVVDRYGQVYDAVDASDATCLPDAGALEEWFRFLATACPECGVLDDPHGRGWVP